MSAGGDSDGIGAGPGMSAATSNNAGLSTAGATAMDGDDAIVSVAGAGAHVELQAIARQQGAEGCSWQPR